MVHLRLLYTIKDIDLHSTQSEINFKFKIVNELRVKLLEPSEEYTKKKGGAAVTFCHAEVSINPAVEILKIIEDIINGDIVKEIEKLSPPYTQMKNHLGKAIIIPSLNFFSHSFQTFIRDIKTELSDAIKKTISVIRWYCDNRGNHSPYAFRKFEFTIDNENWYPVPNSTYISIEANTPTVLLSEKGKKTIEELIQRDLDEPVYHTLFREAWGQKSQNPRSSILMAISAVEVAAKQLIIQVIPEATWLIENVQSPPIVLIFRKFIPTFQVDNKKDGIAILPTNKMLKRLEEWVKIRNKITHLGQKSLHGEELKEMLLTVKDILHIIDFNCGHTWAFNYIRVTTLNEIGIKNF